MPSATAREFQRVARILGFILKRQKAVMEDGIILMGESRQFLSTVRRNRPPLFNQILRQLGITLDEFQKLR
jgi:hypothetical protein